jgi:hypothetical protein
MIRRLFSTLFMNNLKLPICINCKYFMKNITDYPPPYGDPPKDENGKCSKFRSINLVSGSVEYDLAIINRNAELKCGKSGTYFSKK